MAVPPTTSRSLRRRRPIVVLLAVIAIALGASACMPPLVDPPTSGKNFGQGPLEAVYDAATAKATCGLSSVQLSALMMAPTYTEAGGPVPSPMALSRWDNVSVSSSNANLFAFGRTSGAYVNAFFSPGIGMWQFDSAGGWPFSAAGAIDSVTAANQAATTISYRWCNAPINQQTTEAQHRKYAWGPWFGCSTTDACESIYQSLVAGDKLNTAFDATVTRYGGMQQRTCNVLGIGDGLTCWYVSPALGQGSKGWTGGTYNGTGTGVTPLPKPFYVVESGGREYRIWTRDDTGYDIGITASKPITSNARTSLTWAATAGLCDITAARGECTGGADPVGVLDSVSAAGPEKVRVTGWAIDQDTAGPIAVHVYVDNVATAVTANTSRPDVGVAFPGYGENHGYDAVVPATVGTHQVCTYGINVQKGTNQLLGCAAVSVTGFPSGALDTVSAAPGRISVTGWVNVPGDGDPPAVLSVDGVEVARPGTTIARPDVVNAIAGAPLTTGFSATVDATGGPHRVCLTAGGAPLEYVGCRSVTLPSGSPFGSIDAISAGPGSISISGWAIDRDTSASIPVHVYVGASGQALNADGWRPDVGVAFTGYGAAHGFAATLPAGGGPVNVCAYAINVGAGSNTLLGCRSVTVPTGSPIGSLDGVSRTGSGIQAYGWAIDPDTRAPIPVHVYVGPTGYVLNADVDRPDVGNAFPVYGSAHGYSQLLPDPGGRVTVCAYGINSAGSGGNTLLGCRTL
jgi:hypothetical protein